MHEASICDSIIKSLITIAEKEKLAEVGVVTLMIGKIHHIVEDVMHNVYNIMVQEIPILKNSSLVIDMKDVKILCKECNEESILEEVFFVCEKCFSQNIEVIQGKELHIISVQGLTDDSSTQA